MTIRRGVDVKSRIGIGMRLTMYSFTASMLYFNCAEMGMIGDDSATVPNKIRKRQPTQPFSNADSRGHVVPLTNAAILF